MSQKKLGQNQKNIAKQVFSHKRQTQRQFFPQFYNSEKILGNRLSRIKQLLAHSFTHRFRQFVLYSHILPNSTQLVNFEREKQYHVRQNLVFSQGKIRKMILQHNL